MMLLYSLTRSANWYNLPTQQMVVNALIKNLKSISPCLLIILLNINIKNYRGEQKIFQVIFIQLFLKREE